MEADAEISPDPDLSIESLLARLREEADRLAELERAVAEIVLPEGWVWRARLRVTVTGGAWLFRASVLPERR